MAPDSYGVRKDLPYTRFMNYEINKLRQSGMLDVIVGRYSFRQQQCPDDEDSHDKEVSFHKLILPFCVIIVGIGIAFAILSIEKFYHTYCPRYVL